MKVRFMAHVVIGSKSYVPGQVDEIDADMAQELVAKHQAEMLPEVLPIPFEPEPEKPKRKRAK